MCLQPLGYIDSVTVVAATGSCNNRYYAISMHDDDGCVDGNIEARYRE